MHGLQRLMPVEIWMQRIFDAKAAREGGVVRRSLRDVDRIVGRETFLLEMRRRGYHVVENAGQVVIFCNQDKLRLLC
ncbi:MAG: N-(5'-phosphoribosyl)anthranilate isomerase [Pseudomonadota bacterium]